MEKRLNKKIETYITSFKDSVRDKINELEFEEKQLVNDLLEFVYDYERLSIAKDDLVKRKRIKNAIPVNNRCNAKRANGEQCTRRRKNKCEYCGTHMKGTPHGFFQTDENAENTIQKMEVVAEDISGIVYYIDKFNNVYKTEDILEGRQNPRVVAKCIRNNGNTTIPELGLM
jgi:hypothetical protein